MLLSNINYLSVFLSAIAAWLAGAVWYTTLSKQWLSALGKTREELSGPTGKPSPAPFIISLLAEIVMAFILASLMLGLGAQNLAGGIAIGFITWLGFVATTMVVNNSFAGARFRLTLIDGGHWLLVLLVQGAILGVLGA